MKRVSRWIAAIVLSHLIMAPAIAALFFQGPGGEILRKPPPVNEAAAARAERAARTRRQASIADQFELAIKLGNASLDRYYKCVLADCGHELSEAEKLELLANAELNYRQAETINSRDWRAPAGLGRVYSYEQRWTDAESAFQNAVRLKPTDPDLYWVLGLMYSTDKKGTQATKAWERSCALDSSARNYFGCSALASAYRADKRYEDAIRTLRKLIAVLPPTEKDKIVWEHRGLGSLFKDLNRFDDAIEQYREVALLEPTNPGSYEELGDVYRAAKRYDDAINAYLTESKLKPDAPGAYRGLGIVYYERKEYAAATYALRQAIDQSDDDVTYHYLGLSYYDWKQYSQALDPFKQAVIRQPEIPLYHFSLGVTYLHLENKNAAMEQYEALKDLKSDDLANKLLAQINKQ